MAETLETEIATPKQELAREQVEEAPTLGKTGHLGVLPGHAALLSQSGAGLLSYMQAGQRHYLSIAGGPVASPEGTGGAAGGQVAKYPQEINSNRFGDDYRDFLPSRT
jgi:hypothetical protein